MKIYISHSKNFDFQKELYEPLKNSGLKYEFIFPHENNLNAFNSKELFEKHLCDLVLAEVSFSSTGQGIELGWADIFQIPIACCYKSGSKISTSLRMVTKDFIEYDGSVDLINKLTISLKGNIT